MRKSNVLTVKKHLLQPQVLIKHWDSNRESSLPMYHLADNFTGNLFLKIINEVAYFLAWPIYEIIFCQLVTQAYPEKRKQSSPTSPSSGRA